MSDSFDVIVIGAGMAGASLAANLVPHRRVLLLEREAQPGYHTTGRSAALFSEIYGSEAIRALSRASRAFLSVPPAGFADSPLLTPRGTLFAGRPDQAGELDAFDAPLDVSRATRRLSVNQAIDLCPILRRDYLGGAIFEPDSSDVDVHALLSGFLRLFKGRGGLLQAQAGVVGLADVGERWRVETTAGAFSAPVVVNASGAWIDDIARLAGIGAVGAQPLRRTAIKVAAPAESLADAPIVIDVAEEFYFKPESGGLLVSPADETPSPPCDAQAEEWDVAVAVDRLEAATCVKVRHVMARWAGLRTFVADRNPVIGFDPVAPGFFWVGGQGGYGIQTAPALGRLAAALICGQPAPSDISDTGLRLEDVLIDRLR